MTMQAANYWAAFQDAIKLFQDAQQNATFSVLEADVMKMLQDVGLSLPAGHLTLSSVKPVTSTACPDCSADDVLVKLDELKNVVVSCAGAKHAATATVQGMIPWGVLLQLIVALIASLKK